jgi:predicted DNA-binding transcriptional regulator AlpA
LLNKTSQKVLDIEEAICNRCVVMLSTRQAAKRLGLSYVTLSRYIAAGKIPAPKVVMVAGMSIHDWTEAEIEHVRKLLPKIANGRKTRYSKLREKQKAPAGVPVPHKQEKKQTKTKKKA